ncbi:MAG: hypothetical protein HQL32_04115 [Planctomycetes bacterium]|nr:hypothetical protein [Planctomycetota bacterium]
MKFIFPISILLWIVFGQQLSHSQPNVPSEVPKLLLMGEIPRECLEFLQSKPYELHLQREPLSYKSIKHLNVIVIGRYLKELLPSDGKALQAFVLEGGTLILAAQSWSYAAYDKKDYEFPLNALGKKLGFHIESKYAGAPTDFNSHYLSGMKSFDMKGNVPSPITYTGKGNYLIRDKGKTNMAVRLFRGKGSVYVYGHAFFLTNKALVESSISSL